MEILCNLQTGEILEEKATPEDYKTLGVNLLTGQFLRRLAEECEYFCETNL